MFTTKGNGRKACPMAKVYAFILMALIAKGSFKMDKSRIRMDF